jgi:hypothetical protein
MPSAVANSTDAVGSTALLLPPRDATVLDPLPLIVST